MAGKIKPMSQVKQLLFLYNAGRGMGFYFMAGIRNKNQGNPLFDVIIFFYFLLIFNII